MPTALVTGATAGIGAAFARRLAADGMDLVLLARDGVRLENAAKDLHATFAVKAEVLVADLAAEEGIAAAERRVTEGVDLLVNNAGFGHRGRFLDTPITDEVAMLRVHCEAVLRLTYSVLPGMIDRGHGEIINVSSIAAFFPRGTYSASKAWAAAFSQGVNQDVRRKSAGAVGPGAVGRSHGGETSHGGRTGVRVMALCPGFVHTEFHDRADMDMSRFPEFMWLDADTLVDSALRDLRHGVEVSVPGAQYKTLAGIGKLIPRNLLGRMSSRTGRRHR